ncbi:MAG: PQQ-binding-like beta-propeller repeat protein [Planctomycetes bacterium]|nr:PQQ-binding-like beta-propeller repeat protein [Planctomycetota bacterium]
MDRYKLSFVALLTLLLVCSVDTYSSLIGQEPQPAPQLAPNAPQEAEAETQQLTERVFLPPDRSIRQLLDRAEQLLTQQRFSEAVQALNSVLNAPEDYFYRPQGAAPKSGGQTYRSLKSEARRLIGQLPEGGRRSYDLQFGATARRKLDQAVADGDMEAVAEVTRRFCHTEAANEALILLGRYHLDQGRPLAAALCIDQVQRTSAAAVYEPGLSLLLAVCWARAGQPEKATVVLTQVRKSWPDARTPTPDHPDDGVLLSTRPVDRWIAEWSGDLRATRQPEEKEWTLFLGNATRTASAAGGRPLLLRPCWRQRVAMEAGAEQAIATRARQMFDQSVPAVPALYPLAVGDVVLMRAAGRLAAVNIETGKVVWQTDPVDEMSSGGPTDSEQEPSDPQEAVLRHSNTPQRLWSDKTTGTISSDGELVFAIEEPGTPVPGRGRFVVDPFGRRRSAISADASSNVLAAYEVRRSQGKRRWSVGGINGVEPKLEQALFLGPPLPLQGRLYAIAELAGEVRLLVLSAETGRLQWSQQLAVADDEIARDTSRYSGGVSPSFADGVLVCPTTAGAIVALDLTTRSLLWGYQYPRDAAAETSRDPFAPFIRRTVIGTTEIGPLGWRDSCPMIDSGRVIITPSESNQLHCLRLDNGQLEWKVERQNNVYVAGVYEGRVMVVGQEAVTGFALTGARRGQAVATIPLPDGTLPNGRGCYTGQDYYLPLLTGTGAEIARIDLKLWKVADRIACRDGSAAGNLITYRGRVFSQGSDWLQCYHQLDGLKRRVDAALSEKTDDAGALALRAQILIEQHKPTEALPLLRRAYQTYTTLAEKPEIQGSPEAQSQRREAIAERVAVRELLVDGLLEHLKSHFESRQEVSQELARLIDQPDEKIRYLRIVAEGLGKAGDSAGAMDNYFQLVDQAGDGSLLVSADAAHQVRLDRWLAARLGAMAPKLPAPLRAEYDRRVAEHFKRIGGTQAEGLLRSHVTMFGDHPTANVARLRLATLRETPESLLDRVGWLQTVAETGADDARREATARLALLMVEADRADEAVVYYRRLVQHWPNTVCLAGRTGRQLFDALPPGSPVRKRETVSTAWPYGAVKATQATGESRYPLGYQPASELVVAGRSSNESLRVFLDVQQQIISGLDSLGRARWRIPLARDMEGNPFLVNRGLATGRFEGHVLILSLGTHVMGINTLKPGGPRGQGVLWMDECGVGGAAASSSERERPRPWEDDDPSERDFGDTLAQLGPVVAGGATYLRSRELVSVNPLTGKRLWSRRDVPAGSEIFGDDELLLVTPPQGGDAFVLQSVDGALLGRRKVPQVSDRWTTLGRRIVCIDSGAGKEPRLRLFDPWTQQEVWQIPLAPGVKTTLVDETMAALLDRQGKFILLDLSTGKPVFEQQLDEENRLSAIHVMASRDTLIVIANRPRQGEQEASLVESAHENGGPVINGRIYALDRRTGKKLWPSAATVENFALVLEQPTELPLVVFARRMTDRKNGGQKTSFMFIDKRTGALATATREFTRRISNFEIVGDDEKKTVTLHLRSMANMLTLTYTSDPAPPEPPVQIYAKRKDKDEPGGDVFGKTLRELGKAVKQLEKPPADRGQQEKDLFGE